jgi:EAL domain-containing protein (putative c-di-GMP-specific phosphodiesterase class I)
MSLVWEYFRTPDPMLPLCINLAQNIGASVTAEGVEERHMAEELHRQGCDYLQGYYFSPPVPMEDFVRKYRLDSGN